MKKILTLTAATMVLAASTAFASCPLTKVHTNSCNIGVPTGAAAPVSYIVAPVQQRTYLPPCNTCDPCKNKKKGFFSKMFSPVRGVYDATFGQIFTNLY